MPIFEYTCSKCGKYFDVLVFSDAKGKPVCPSCGSEETTKMVSTLGWMKHPDDSGPGVPRSGGSCGSGGCCSGSCESESIE